MLSRQRQTRYASIDLREAGADAAWKQGHARDEEARALTLARAERHAAGNIDFVGR